VSEFKISLRAARVNAEMTQAAAAEAIGVARETIATWEQGSPMPPGDKLWELCNLYGAPIDAIFLGKKFA